MTAREKRFAKAKELRAKADRYEDAVSSDAGPSSQEWVSPERREHYMHEAFKLRQQADRLERQ